MLDTVIDHSVFEHFINNQPKPVPFGSMDDNAYWLSFWNFLKGQSNVLLTNFTGENNIFLNNLTTGRNGTKIAIEENYKKPHKGKFPKDTNPQTVFFLNEPSMQQQKKYKKENGMLFGFMNDYPKIWKLLVLYEKAKVLPVRKNAKAKFESWDQLSDYILPFSDLIIVDNYMFDETLWDYNLFKIIQLFATKTSVKFNLLLVSFADGARLISYKNIFDVVKEKLIELKINCNLSIVFAPQTIKEHDRGIFTNYLRIKSGDSFVYFDKAGKYKTKGTDIDFHSLAEPDNFNASSAALKSVNLILTELQNHPEKEKRLMGNLKNRLI